MNNKPQSSLIQKISAIFCAVFGRMHWNCPPWIQYLGQQSRQAPIRFWSGIVFLFIFISSLAYLLYWYQTQPEPHYVTASIASPEITPNQEELIPKPLTIRFGTINEQQEWISQSVAPLHSVGKIVDKGIELIPQLKGEWHWENDNVLIFTPAEDWPADQKFTVHTDADFFSSTTRLKSHDFEFSTQPFVASIKEFKFYQDPVHAEKRQAVATLEFNFPVNETTLKENTLLSFLTTKNNTKTPEEKPINFSYTFDANKRIAYLHSDTIQIKNVARYLQLLIKKDTTASSGASLAKDYSSTLLIPDNTNFLKVISASASIVRDDRNKPEQIVTIETSLGINEKELNQSLHVYVLPEDYPATRSQDAIKNYAWQNPGEVTPAILSLAHILKKEAIPTEYNYSNLHSFKFAMPTPRYLYVKIDKGMKGMGGFALNTTYQTIIPVPEYPKEISFLHKGSLLSINGEKKLSVLVRGVPAVKFELARVLPDNINQLITQTEGDFNNPYFINPTFNQQNISQINSEIQSFAGRDLSQQQYTTLNLEHYLNTEQNTELGPKGLFLIQAKGWDESNEQELDIKTSRLVLLTDLGLLVKDNNDGSHDVFVESISEGKPVLGVNVTVLGKNGLPVLSRTTNELGQAHFPSLKDFVEDRAPVVYLATLNEDVSFIPFNNYNRQLNFSKFDIGGLYNSSEDPSNLSAYLFSDRGIYRPGDTIHIGAIIKQAFAKPQPAGLPLQITIQDPRGSVIKDNKIALNAAGFINIDFKTNPTSPTGQYTINVYAVKDEDTQNYLGTTTIRVAEFQPDRMRIHAELIPNSSEGWISPDDLKAKISLWNLYGAPATDRKVTAQLSLTPEKIQFETFPEYVFSDPLYDAKKPLKTYTETLKEVKTDNGGLAEFPLNLERYEKGTYRLTVFAEGFEADSGRSVTTQIKALVSPLPYFVGYKADGDLHFIKQSGTRTIQFIAVTPQLTQENANDLKVRLFSLHPITTLVKKADGTYQYQSVMKTSLVSSSDFKISEQGTSYVLPTTTIGNYLLEVVDKNNTQLSQLHFNVVGASQKPLAKNAELTVTLDREAYQAGEDIELQITAPYTGSGLITIERDKVYAAQWFKAQTPNSVQTIRIPADFQGDGYVNVAFIRDWDSPELFISPLSYSVVPFSVSHEDHKINITLHANTVGRPGTPFKIQYQTDNPGKIIIFAVDEGILQVSRYTTPDPLAFFFQKHALQVLTQQTVDQILPKFLQERELSAVGGDDGSEDMANHLNPFKRKTDLPVAYWSGILDADSNPREVSYVVPDYFNGSMRIMAVAVSDDALGSAETSAAIRGDFIFNPNIPTFVAPGDEFEISSTVANTLKNSGDKPLINISIDLSEGLELIGSRQTRLEIPEGHENTVHFKMRAKSILGSAKITLTAQYQNHSASLDSTLSIRPASPLITTIDSGKTNESLKRLNVTQSVYPEHRTVEATWSTTPLIYVFGLNHYLENYPYGCTEQLTSKALPFLVMSTQSWFHADHEQVQDKINNTIALLSQRQMTQGGFSYWPGGSDNSGNAFASVYAMHFLTEAREQEFNVSNELFYNGLSYLKDLASQTPTDLDTARVQAYAIYILTRNELVTTNYLANLQNYLQQHHETIWQKDILSAYIAASYQLLKNSEEANHLISLYDFQNPQNNSSDFYNKNSSNAQYLYLVAKHFPNILAHIDSSILMQLTNAMNNDELNTVLAGYMSLALGAYPQPEANTTTTLSITELLNNNQTQKLTNTPGLLYQKMAIDFNTQQVLLNNPEKITYFYQLLQSGFSKKDITQPVSKGIEIYREYRNAKGDVTNTASLGEEIEVYIQIRSLAQPYQPHIAIEDLLPGGFEVLRESLPKEYSNYTDAREDRVNFFMDISDSVTTLVYKIKAINAGEYTVPPIYAQAMYNPNQYGHGVTATMRVTH